jgi:acetyl/propionyl-CoA carboxylase alpha subunit
MKFQAQLDGEAVPVEATGAGGRYRVAVGGDVLEVDARPTGAGGWSLLLGRESFAAGVTEEDGGVFVVDVDGETYSIRVEEETRYIMRTRGAGASAAGQILKAPMPGRVVMVEVSVGQAVVPGDGLVILEAMKMENEFKASVTGTVKEIRVEAGQAVNPGDVLVVVE